MVVTTFYFSGTGNTKWVVEQFHHILKDKGHTDNMISIDRMEEISDETLQNMIQQSDWIGFANPIYGANIPPIMRKFICRLNQLMQRNKEKHKPVYIINTVGYINAFGPFAAKKLLEHSFFSLRIYINIQLCNNISTPKHKSKPLKKEEFQKRKEIAVTQLKELYEKMLLNQDHITGIGPYLLPGIIIRYIFKHGVTDNYASLSVRKESCIHCMRCVENCPTGSIRYNELEEFEFLPTCTACMRCYNYCPKCSIQIDNQYADPNYYHRFRGPDLL
jgi:Dissimilatory sulfite reductase (desulfoviridin), alpha and beta subunits